MILLILYTKCTQVYPAFRLKRSTFSVKNTLVCRAFFEVKRLFSGASTGDNYVFFVIFYGRTVVFMSQNFCENWILVLVSEHQNDYL